MAVNKSLLNYVKTNLKKGYSQESLKKALKNAGWRDSDIDEAFKEAGRTAKKGKAAKALPKKKGQKPIKKPKGDARLGKAAKVEKPTKDARPEKSSQFEKPNRPGQPKQTEKPSKTQAAKKEDKKNKKQAAPAASAKEQKRPLLLTFGPDYLETDADKLYLMIVQKGSVKVSEASKKLNIPEEKIEEWGDILEEHNMCKMHYPPVGSPVIISKETMEKKKEKRKGKKSE